MNHTMVSTGSPPPSGSNFLNPQYSSPSASAPSSNAKVVQDCHQCLLWLIPLLDHFPRQRRFTLGDRIETRLLSVLSLLVEASYSTQSADLLAHANRELGVLKHLWRLAFELKIISAKRYGYGVKQFLDIGQQVGGWQKQARLQSTPH